MYLDVINAISRILLLFFILIIVGKKKNEWRMAAEELAAINEPELEGRKGGGGEGLELGVKGMS